MVPFAPIDGTFTVAQQNKTNDKRIRQNPKYLLINISSWPLYLDAYIDLNIFGEPFLTDLPVSQRHWVLDLKIKSEVTALLRG